MSVKEKPVVVRRSPRISDEEYRAKLGLKRLSIFGEELPDPTVIEPPVNFKKEPSIFEHQRMLIQQEIARRAAEEGFETPEEAENFNINEDEHPTSRHQYTEMEEEQINRYVEYYNGEIAKAKAAKAAKNTSSKSNKPAEEGADAGGVSPKGDPAASAQDAV